MFIFFMSDIDSHINSMIKELSEPFACDISIRGSVSVGTFYCLTSNRLVVLMTGSMCYLFYFILQKPKTSQLADGSVISTYDLNMSRCWCARSNVSHGSETSCLHQYVVLNKSFSRRTVRLNNSCKHDFILS